MRYLLVVTGPAYGSEQSTSALLFAKALVAAGHQLALVFFYQDGVYNANKLTMPASDEVNMVQQWVELADAQQFTLSVCIAASLRRGIIDVSEASQRQDSTVNCHPCFNFSGLGVLAEQMLTCDRVVQF
jgi:tRNA 2-thiouridine synthesizing protein D